MTEDTLSKVTIITNILNNGISIALEKLSILLDKSETTNIDRDFIVSVSNDFENENVIYKKPTTQGLDSYFIAFHMVK